MFNSDTLKTAIEVTDNTVECPVKGCGNSVARQRKVFRRSKEFQCPVHKLFVSPSTFEYEDKTDNLLWTDDQDIELLDQILSHKRESRMGRERSEDALSWNVFRFLERTNLVDLYFSNLTKRQQEHAQIVYWSYSQAEQSSWSELIEARNQFGEKPQRGSEPDLITYNDKTLLFVEAKLEASNKTVPSNPSERKKYLTGGDGWFRKVFKTDYEIVAIEDKRYELMRFWLLGTWLAAQTNRDFYLISLVLNRKDGDLVSDMRRHLVSTERRTHLRTSWEDLYEWIKSRRTNPEDFDQLLNYMRNKSIGYDSRGRLRKAFKIS